MFFMFNVQLISIDGICYKFVKINARDLLDVEDLLLEIGSIWVFSFGNIH